MFFAPFEITFLYKNRRRMMTILDSNNYDRIREKFKIQYVFVACYYFGSSRYANRPNCFQRVFGNTSCQRGLKMCNRLVRVKNESNNPTRTANNKLLSDEKSWFFFKCRKQISEQNSNGKQSFCHLCFCGKNVFPIPNNYCFFYNPLFISLKKIITRLPVTSRKKI